MSMSDAPQSAVFAYQVDGPCALPTEHARGPWFADQQHGAAILGLLARYLEQVPSPVPMRLTRITADISRAVPMSAITVHAAARRAGRRVQSLEATVSEGDQVLARAVATRIRTEPNLVPADRLPPVYPDDQPPPLGGTPTTYDMGYPTFHDCLEIQLLEEPDQFGNNRTWWRMAHPLVEGEAPSPLVRVASIADMIMSSATALGPGWMSINPEVSLQLERYPTGEWLCMTSSVRFTDDGIGVSEGVIHDTTRRIGASSKSVLNTPRPS
jgi:hypothetical protein